MNPTNKRTRITAVVVTYNGADYIEKCIDSLLESTCECRIIIVDNCSTDNTIQILQKYGTSIKLIRSKKNLGFGKANNVGMKEAILMHSDYIFLLNQDAWVKPDTIEKLIEINKSFSSYGIISPLQINTLALNTPGEQVEDYFSTYIKRDLISDAVLDKSIKEIYSVPLVDATAWLLPNDTIKKVGGFDPLFYHYGEDYNYCHRVLQHGLRLGICPHCHIFHDRERQQREQIRSSWYRGLDQFTKQKYLKQLLDPKHSFYKEYKLYTRIHYKRIIISMILLRKKDIYYHYKVLHSLKDINHQYRKRIVPDEYAFLDIDQYETR